MKKFLFIFIFFFSTYVVFADATSTPICTSLNSLFPYNKTNVTTIQTFLQDKYFSNVKITGTWDLQTKKYIKTFQYSYGLNLTGKLNDETLNLFRSVAHCYIIENGILNFPPKKATSSVATTTATNTFIRASSIFNPLLNQEDIIAILIKTFNIDTTPVPASLQNKIKSPQLRMVVLDSTDQKYKYLHDSISSSLQIQDLVSKINNKFNWTNELKVTFENCNAANAYFDNNNNNIVMCYEYLDFFVQNNSTNISIDEKVNQAANFIFLHQVGHALIYYFNLPTTGNNESAADEFAMYALINFANPAEINSTISGIKQLYYLAINQNVKTQYLANIHAPTISRYYDLIAYYLGAFPDQNNFYMGQENWQLSGTKSENIDTNFTQKNKTWAQLLMGHIK